uniref:Putative ovule protein n=1 Tax=Solanum chacoense TaxID=4108 RepID=A0A0V0H083_SOLCH
MPAFEIIILLCDPTEDFNLKCIVLHPSKHLSSTSNLCIILRCCNFVGNCFCSPVLQFVGHSISYGSFSTL